MTTKSISYQFNVIFALGSRSGFHNRTALPTIISRWNVRDREIKTALMFFLLDRASKLTDSFL